MTRREQAIRRGRRDDDAETKRRQEQEARLAIEQAGWRTRPARYNAGGCVAERGTGRDTHVIVGESWSSVAHRAVKPGGGWGRSTEGGGSRDPATKGFL